METLLTTALEREIEAAQGNDLLLKALCNSRAEPSRRAARRMDSGMAGKARAVR
ncbi:MAG: hypothetical protein ACLTV6_04995 [Christensenellales bacterium]